AKREPFSPTMQAKLALTLSPAGGLAFNPPCRRIQRTGQKITTGNRCKRDTENKDGTLAEATMQLAPGCQIGDFVHGDAAPDEMLDAADLVAFGVRREGVGLAVATGTAGAADPVNIVFSLHGQVVVEGVADALHVNAAGGNVGGHQNAQLATLQQTQGAGALTLVHVAMKGTG